MKNFFATLVLGLFCSVCLISCSKNTPIQMGLDAGITYINLNLDASYLVDSDNPIIKNASSSKYLTQNKPTTTSKFNANFYSEFNLEETKRNSYKSTSFKSVKFNKLSAKEGTTMPTDTNNPKYKKMEEGVRYMVLIFDHEDNHVGSTLATVGEETRVPVRYKASYELSANNSYRIVAFSFNTKDADQFNLLNLDPTHSTNNPEIVFPSDKEFYYHNSDFLLDPKTNYENPPKLNVIFFPKTVRVGITVDARGVDANVKKVSGSFSSFGYRKTARFDLKLNRVVEKINLDESAFPYDFTIEGDHDSLSISRFVYMDDEDGAAELSNFKVVLKELVLQRNGDANETTILASPATKSYEFGNISLTKGKYFNGRINLVSGFEVSGILWSYGNLYYDSLDTSNKYKIRKGANEGYQDLETDYWAFNSVLSGVNRSGDVDPCTLVYPQNTWRMPTEADARNLYNNSNLESSYYYGRNIDDISYVEYKNKSSENTIQFYGHGYYRNYDNFVGSEDASYYGMFWLSTGTSILKDVFMFTINRIDFTRATPQYSITENLTTSRHRMNIRCVRELRD